LRNFLRRRFRVELTYHAMRKILRSGGSAAAPTRFGFQMGADGVITSRRNRLSENFPDICNPQSVKTFDLLFDHGYRAVTVNMERRPVRRDDVVGWNAAGRTPDGVYNYLFCR
jgi:hypothetical protein